MEGSAAGKGRGHHGGLGSKCRRVAVAVAAPPRVVPEAPALGALAPTLGSRPLAPDPGASGLRPTWSHCSPSQTAFLHIDAVCLGPCFFPLELQKAASAFFTPRT